MKVERKEEKAFVPITITLESQVESDALFTLVSRVSGDGPYSKATVSLYDLLKPYSNTRTLRSRDYNLGVNIYFDEDK